MIGSLFLAHALKLKPLQNAHLNIGLIDFLSRRLGLSEKQILRTL